ncbi:hypothetical protein V8C86DRAFT_2798798 [Haematococcus lacustris]
MADQTAKRRLSVLESLQAAKRKAEASRLIDASSLGKPAGTSTRKPAGNLERAPACTVGSSPNVSSTPAPALEAVRVPDELSGASIDQIRAAAMAAVARVYSTWSAPLHPRQGGLGSQAGASTAMALGCRPGQQGEGSQAGHQGGGSGIGLASLDMVWRVFPTQQQAFDFLDAQPGALQPLLRVFSQEVERAVASHPTEAGEPAASQPQVVSSRRFLVTSLPRFWREYSQHTSPEDRHFYEIIREARPCHLYFDLEFSRPDNPGLDGALLVAQLVQLLALSLKRPPPGRCWHRSCLA